MEKKLAIKPFNKFWINCIVNDLLSILETRKAGYDAFAFMNAYQYDILGEVCWWRNLEIAPNQYYSKKLLERVNCIDVDIDKENYVKNLKKLIDENRNVYVLIDIYDWLEERVDYHRKHLNHYVMLTGYNDEKNEFYFFCDTLKGYGEYAVPYEKLKEAIVLNAKEAPQVQEILIDEEITDYTFTETEVYEYGKKLRRNLVELTYMRCWILPPDTDTSAIFYMITKIEGRQWANLELFQYFLKKNIISKNLFQVLEEKLMFICMKWQDIKKNYMKAFCKHVEPNYEELNLLARKCFELEVELWDFFL